MTYQDSHKVKTIIDESSEIVVVQADNPDADSLGSALALEAILNENNKKVHLYCPVDMPEYIKYLRGWDRVSFSLPHNFDTTIFVDVSTLTLLEKSKLNGDLKTLLTKKIIVIDHHANVSNTIQNTDSSINDTGASSTGEVIFNIAEDLGWKVPADAIEPLMSSILGDTQGLTNSLASAKTYSVMSKLVEMGGNRPQLEERRREYSKMPEIIYKYKADLIKRTRFASNSEIAYVVIPQNEINSYSALYNPAPLIQNDMLQVSGVKLAIVFKTYDDMRITGALRSNLDAPIAGKVAELMGGGGHDLASGFKITNSHNFDQVINEVLAKAEQEIKNLNQ